MTAKTGGLAGAWVPLDRPKPTPVADRYLYWLEQPPRLSDRCTYWVRQFEAGFRPNKWVRRESYDSAAEWYGVYIWEYQNVIAPLEYAPRG
jgi:hypothetical protein